MLAYFDHWFGPQTFKTKIELNFQTAQFFNIEL